MTNFFAPYELLCEECGEVSVTNFKPFFPGDKLSGNFTTKKSTTHFPLKLFKFHHLELLGALLRKKSVRFPAPQNKETLPFEGA